MELQGLYELHERLGAAAVAGVNLIGDDFRLRRAVEQIRPLAQAVPVIKKLYTMAENVMAPDCEDRPGCLLDALALSEALLCTQAGYETGYHIGQDSGDALTRPEPEAGAEAGAPGADITQLCAVPALQPGSSPGAGADGVRRRTAGAHHRGHGGASPCF